MAATAFHLLTGSPPFQNSNPAVVISQHLSASPPAIGAHRPELSALDPVLAKAMSKDPKDRFERCADFARAFAHRLDAAPTGDVGTTLAPAATPPKRSLLRAGVVVPAILAVLLVAAITVAVMEFRRADRPEAPTTTANAPTATSPTFTPLPPPPEPVQPPTTPSPPPTTAAATPVAVIGANCSPVGSTATTADGATAYCSTLQTTGASIWSLQPRRCAKPDGHDRADRGAGTDRGGVAGAGLHATDRPDWLRCREDIRRSNRGLP